MRFIKDLGLVLATAVVLVFVLLFGAAGGILLYSSYSDRRQAARDKARQEAEIRLRVEQIHQKYREGNPAEFWRLYNQGDPDQFVPPDQQGLPRLIDSPMPWSERTRLAGPDRHKAIPVKPN